MNNREVGSFLVVGGLTILVDYLSYWSLFEFDVLSVGPAKAAGFLCGTSFAYFANRRWTFGTKRHKPGGLRRFLVLYAGSFGANIIVNSLALNLLANMHWAFLLATAISASINFLGMKFFVFTSITNSASK